MPGTQGTMSVVDTLDRAQKRTAPSSVSVATWKKFSEDHSTNLASLIAFWAFFSIFPLLLVGVTVLGWVLPAGDKHSVLTRVAEMFPLLEPGKIATLSGSWWALALGVFSALWSGIAVVNAMQVAFNSVWEIPYHRRPGKAGQVLRSIGVLSTVGVGLVATTLLSGFIASSSTGVDIGLAGRIGGYVLAIVADVALVVATFRILTPREVSVRDVLPGALLTGISFFVLQELSAYIISRHLKSAQSTYGHFATVITILWWFYLQALITLLGAQLNVVLKERLYPRTLAGEPRTEPDKRALQAYAEERTYHPRERVHTEVVDGQREPGR
jgi:YihY family inner membrane protein